MPARPIATGSISFGLVAIPVKLYPATETSTGVHFNLLDKETKSRVKQQYIRATDGQIVARNNMVKGYEFAKGEFVTFTTEELKAMEEKSSQVIEISEFVPIAEVDPIYFDKPYYLAPEKGGEKAYRLLCEVMRETGRCAIARYAARGKQYLVLVRPTKDKDGNGLVMQQLVYADEIRAFSEVPINDVEVKMSELQLARQLVEQIAVQTFDPRQYKDEVRERILADIQRKIDGHEIETAGQDNQPAQIIDLMEALKASLDAQQSAARARAAGGANQSTATAPDIARRPAKRAHDSDGTSQSNGDGDDAHDDTQDGDRNGGGDPLTAAAAVDNSPSGHSGIAREKVAGKQAARARKK